MKRILTQYRSEILKNAFSAGKLFKPLALSLFSILFIFTATGAYLLRKESRRELDNALAYQTEDAPTAETLLLKLNVNRDLNAPEPFTLGAITQYNSRVDKALKFENAYTLNIINNGEVVYSTSFDIPSSISEGIDPVTNQPVHLAISSTDSISFRIPYFNEGVAIEVTNKAGDTVLADTIRDVQVINNDAPNYTTTRGDEVTKEEQRSN